MVAPSPSNTAAVVVLFYPVGDLVDRLRRVRGQVSRLVLVANDGLPVDRLLGFMDGDVRYLQEAKNRGLGAGLNRGLKIAADEGMSWALLLDQDTLVDLDLVPTLCALYHLLPHPESVAVIAPNYRSPRSGKLARAVEPTVQPAEVAITSGSMVSLAISKSVGGMKEAFFIEGIDLEYSLRIRGAGFRLWISGKPLMTHGAGDCEERSMLGRTVLVTHHPPWRYYLQFRNVTWLLWRYAMTEPNWSSKTISGLAKKIILMIIFERQRGAKICSILCGIFDGSIGRLHRVDHLV